MICKIFEDSEIYSINKNYYKLLTSFIFLLRLNYKVDGDPKLKDIYKIKQEVTNQALVYYQDFVLPRLKRISSFVEEIKYNEEYKFELDKIVEKSFQAFDEASLMFAGVKILSENKFLTQEVQDLYQEFKDLEDKFIFKNSALFARSLDPDYTFEILNKFYEFEDQDHHGCFHKSMDLKFLTIDKFKEITRLQGYKRYA